MLVVYKQFLSYLSVIKIKESSLFLLFSLPFFAKMQQSDKKVGPSSHFLPDTLRIKQFSNSLFS